MKGKYLGKTEEGYTIWECPFCGKITYQGNIFLTGILWDEAGCKHWSGIGNEDEYFEEIKENKEKEVVK